MEVGLVQWFNPIRGFGVMVTSKSKEVFIHKSNCKGIDPYRIERDDVFIFNIAFERGKYTGKNIKIPKGYDHLKVLMKLLENESINSNTVPTTTGENVNLLKTGLRHWYNHTSKEHIVEYLEKYFLKHILTKKHHLFTAFCEAIQGMAEKIDQASLNTQLYHKFDTTKNEELQFHAWKNKSFAFLGYPDEYEIPEEILWQNKTQLDNFDLLRVAAYQFGEYFLNRFFNWMLSQLEEEEQFSFDELLQLYGYSALEKSDEIIAKNFKEVLFCIIKDRLAISVKEIIRNNNVAPHSWDSVLNSLPLQDESPFSNIEKEELEYLFLQQCPQDIALNLWIEGKLTLHDFDNTIKSFFEHEDKQLLIFERLHSDNDRLKILLSFLEKKGWKKTVDLLTAYLSKVNNLGYNFSLEDTFLDEQYWKEKKGGFLVKKLANKFAQEEDSLISMELYLAGYKLEVDFDFLYTTIGNYSAKELDTILRKTNHTLQLKLLKKRIDILPSYDELTTTLKFGKKHLHEPDFIELDNYCFNHSEVDCQLNLWKEKFSRKFPNELFLKSLDDQPDIYKEIDKWLNYRLIKSDEIENLLTKKLTDTTSIESRKEFYCAYNIIKKLIELNPLWQERILDLRNDFFTMILWSLEVIDTFNFEILKGKFIYLKPEEQVNSIKRIFQYKAQGKFDLTLEKLDELKRVSLDIYKLNPKLNTDIPLDLTIDLIIESLKNFKQTGKFLANTELFTVVLNNLYNDPKRKFTINDFFDKCNGRTKTKFNYAGDKIITKIPHRNSFYFSIQFSYDENILAKVRNLPGRKWSDFFKFWGVPGRYEKEVLAFGRAEGFKFEFDQEDASFFENNSHLAYLYHDAEDIPRGIKFCDGQPAKKLHKTTKKEFWWCANQPCFQNCVINHSIEDWKNYTMLDFCNILGLNTDEEDIPNGKYLKYVSRINRFERLLEHLYCRSCEHILYPTGVSNFAAYTAIRFHCTNQSCTECNKKVYLNHCLDGRCNSIIDSRDSKRCTYYEYPDFLGLYICTDCGACCSHAMLTRRLDNLELTGGNIHPNLRIKVEKQLGHLEKAEYYCYNCSEAMTEHSDTLFKCDDCSVVYDLEKLRRRHPNKHLRRKNYSETPPELPF